MSELWKPVVGYEGLYEVSNLGSVRSLDRLVGKEKSPRKGRLLAAPIDRSGAGYRFVNLSKNGKVRKTNLHVLVLEAFIGPRPHPDWHAMHIDGSRDNARLDNLRWGSQSENARDKVAHGTDARGGKNKNAILNQELVDWIKESKQSSIQLGHILGVSSSTIRAVRLGENWSYAY